MKRPTLIALAAILLLSATVAASAATRHHRATHARSPTAGAASEPIITNQCLPTDNPCRTKPDGW